MNVAPLKLMYKLPDLTLNPLDKKSSNLFESVVSEYEPLGNNEELAALYVFLAESITVQSSAESVLLINIYLGLKPKYTNGPSVLPLPV